MKIGEVLRVEYDDDQLDVIDLVNEALEEHGLAFVDDEQPHDGFCLLTLTRVDGNRP